jgi:endonuclease I
MLLVAGATVLCADPPADYYATAQGKAGQPLRDALHTIIRNHKVLPYTSGAFDTSDALKVLDAAPTNANFVTLVYNGSNQLISVFGSNTGWNREHLWPNSYGLDDVEPSYSDLHNLRACDATVNSSRGNKYYDVTTTNAPGYAFPAHPEAPLCSTDADSWETRPGERGDIARAMFYLTIRYTGDYPREPALRLTDDETLITETNSYMGRLNTLLAWHQSDPVDAAETLRNDRIYSLYQTNRNPFVDHPEWVNLTVSPAHTLRPVLNISLASTNIILTWLATNQSNTLEFSTNLVADWSTVTNVPTLTNGQFRLLWNHPATTAVFRLRVP